MRRVILSFLCFLSLGIIFLSFRQNNTPFFLKFHKSVGAGINGLEMDSPHDRLGYPVSTDKDRGELRVKASVVLSSFDDENVNFVKKGDIYLTQSLYDEAIEEYKKALEIDTDNYQAYLGLGKAYSEKGDFKEDNEYYQNIIRRNSMNENNYYTLGVAYEDKGEMDKAIEYFLKTIDINPYFAPAYHSLGDVYGKKGYYKEEMDYLKKSIQLNPRDVDVYFISEIPYGRKLFYNKSKAYFLKAVKFKPFRADAYFSLGELYIKLADLYTPEINSGKAIEYFQKAVKLQPDNAQAYYFLGSIFKGKDKHDKAADYFLKAIKAGYYDKTGPYYNLADIYINNRDYDKVLYYCREILNIVPEHIDANYLIGKAYIYKHNKTAALQQVNKLRQLNEYDLAEQLEELIN